MNKQIVFMFSGQGSQYYHMGEELFKESLVFKKWMLKMDNLVFDKKGRSVIEELYNKKYEYKNVFKQIKYTHPAIFMVEYALAQVLIENEIKPDIVLGTSMGEYAAGAVAEIISMENMLELVVEQADMFEDYCAKGAMLAIFADPKLFNEDNTINSRSVLAAVNYNSHFVVTGEECNLKTIENYIKNKGIGHQMIPVEYGFHSELIDSARNPFLALLEKKDIKEPKIRFVSSVRNSKDITKKHFWNAAREPIEFLYTVSEMEKDNQYTYLDLGPGSSLSSYVRRIISKQSSSICFPVIVPFQNRDIKNLNELITKCGEEKKTMEKTAYVFPGQGSQSKGMGEDLFIQYAEMTKSADEILAYSIQDLCLNDPQGVLGNTRYTQPALFVINAMSYRKRLEDNREPDYVAGHSLAEYNALYAAGAFDFETGLKLVKKRAELMSEAEKGGMAAVIGLGAESILNIITDNNFGLYIANYNSPSQIVISGIKDDIMLAKSKFEEAGARYIPLKVSGAFHSPFMKNAAEEFEKYIGQFHFSELKIPVISNVHARPYKSKDIISNLVSQIVSPVKWTESVRFLMGKGVTDIIQIGPGNVLTGLVAKIKKEAQPLFVNEEEETGEVKEIEEVIISAESEIIKEEEPEIVLEEGDEGTEKTDSSDTLFKLGSSSFMKTYHLKYPYMAGGMYAGISSAKMVVALRKAGMLGIIGTLGLPEERLSETLIYVRGLLKGKYDFGVNFTCDLNNTDEEKFISLLLSKHVHLIEASNFMNISKALVMYRLKGIKRGADQKLVVENRIIAKVTRIEMAENFMKCAPEAIVDNLVQEGRISREEAGLSAKISMADEICVISDSGGFTDRGSNLAFLPAVIKLRDEIMRQYKYENKILIGTGGGIGTPEAAASTFALGAEFIITGSINQCTVEADTSKEVKDLLQKADIGDTDYAPVGNMFEIGMKAQVLKKGSLYSASGNRLYSLYVQYNSWEDIDPSVRKKIQDKYFKQDFSDIYQEIIKSFDISTKERLERNPKSKMALVFKWYFFQSMKSAIDGDRNNKMNYQIMCGPSIGAFNRWVKGTPLEQWENRHVDKIGKKIMEESYLILKEMISSI